MKLLAVLISISLKSIWVYGSTTNQTEMSDVYLAQPQLTAYPEVVLENFICNWVEEAEKFWREWVVTPIKVLRNNIDNWVRIANKEAHEFYRTFSKVCDEKAAEHQETIRRIIETASGMGKNISICTHEPLELLKGLSSEMKSLVESCAAHQFRTAKNVLDALNKEAANLESKFKDLRAKLDECKGKSEVKKRECSSTLTRQTDESVKTLHKTLIKDGAVAEEMVKNFKPYYLSPCSSKLSGTFQLELDQSLEILIYCIKVYFPQVAEKIHIKTSGSSPTQPPASFLIVVTIMFVQIIMFFK